LLCCGGSPRASSPATGLVQRQIDYQQVVYSFEVFLPSSYNGTHQLPATLLIHGGGGKGQDMIAAWQNFAEQTAIILVAPTVPLG